MNPPPAKCKALFVFAVQLLLFAISEYRTRSTSPVRNIETLDVENGTSFVILLSYMRSGSSFVGNILRKSEEVFYICESLHYGRRRVVPTLFSTKQNEWCVMASAIQVISNSTKFVNYLHLRLVWDQNCRCHLNLCYAWLWRLQNFSQNFLSK